MVIFRSKLWVYRVHDITMIDDSPLYQHILTYKLPSGKRLHNYGKIHHAINGTKHYFYGHVQ